VNMKVAVLFSSGKDSCYTVDRMKSRGHEISCLITMYSENEFSYMFHTANVRLAELQAEAMGIAILTWKTKGEKEEELKDLGAALEAAKKKYGIEAVAVGAIASNYQKQRVEKLCKESGLTFLAPLWQKKQEKLLREMINRGYKIVFSSVSAMGLDKSYLGKEIDENIVDYLTKLDEKYGFNVSGEGGEFETLVLDGPIFKKKLLIDDYEVVKKGPDSYVMLVKKAHLALK